MRGFREFVELKAGWSFRAERTVLTGSDYGLHHHPQSELTVFAEASGVRGVGDSVEAFFDGDMALIPPNMPHFWNIPKETTKAGERSFVLHVVKFTPQDWGPFLDLPEMSAVKRLLVGNLGGYAITPEDPPFVHAAIAQIHDAPPALALSRLMGLLGYIAEHAQLRRLSRGGTLSEGAPATRLERVFAFLHTHFRRRLTLEEVSAVAHLSPNAFSRFFSRAIGKPFSRYLIELRLSWACHRLLDTDETILALSLDSGFASLTHFNRCFRAHLGMTPREYRKHYGR